MVLFQSKYSRKLDTDSNFPANAIEKAVNTIKCVFDPSTRIRLNVQSQKKVEEIQSFILDGAIPYVTFVMLNNSLSWNQDGQNHINNAFAGQGQVTMICKKFSFNALQEQNWMVKTEDLQIINGGQTCKTIHQTVKENLDLDFSQTYLLVRLYEVEDTENPGIIQDIIYATNSQNPVDFRDLKSNDVCQRILETGAHDLGYVYKRKRDSTLNINVIPSTVAAEAVFAVWRESPL